MKSDINRAVYLFFGLLMLVFSVLAIIATCMIIVNDFSFVLGNILAVFLLGGLGIFILVASIFSINKAWTYSEEEEILAQRRRDEAAAQKIENKKHQDALRRENNPHLLKSLEISGLGMLIVLCGLLLFGGLYLFTRDTSYLWGLGIFGVPTILFSIASELQGKRISDVEKLYIDFVTLLFRSIKWISIAIILFLLGSAFVGWVSGLSATTIIIILLILLLFKNK